MSLSSVLDTAVNKDKSPHAYGVHVELLEEGDEAKTKQCTVDSGARGCGSENKMQPSKIGHIIHRRWALPEEAMFRQQSEDRKRDSTPDRG